MVLTGGQLSVVDVVVVAMESCSKTEEEGRWDGTAESIAAAVGVPGDDAEGGVRD